MDDRIEHRLRDKVELMQEVLNDDSILAEKFSIDLDENHNFDDDYFDLGIDEELDGIIGALSDEMEKELEILLKIHLNEENGDLFNNKDVLNYFINTLGIRIVDISTMRVIEDIILNLVERGIIDGSDLDLPPTIIIMMKSLIQLLVCQTFLGGWPRV